MMGGHHAKFTPTLQCLTMTAAHFRPFRHCKAFYGFPTYWGYMAIQTVFKQELRIKNIQPSGSIHEAKGYKKIQGWLSISDRRPEEYASDLRIS